MGVLSGMTGFARVDGQTPGWSWTWEARSVNGKGLEARFRLPTGFERLESKARDLAKAHFTRGNVNATLNLRRESEAGGGRIDLSRLRSLIDQAAPLLESGAVQRPTLDGLLALPGMIDSDQADEGEDTDALDKAILASLGSALEGLRAARREEGAALCGVLTGHVEEITRLTAEAAGHAATRTDAIRDRIAAKFTELLPDGLPEDRLATEAAMLAVKMDVREELDRLHAHIGSARELLARGSPVGRKLDFLSQEFNREANTLCSKSSDSSLTAIGLSLKNTVDQFREQIQNVE
ncbi:YicC/YloC family endoribonuclease [Maricaulis sp.]|uniref:YicC/YloC family endoribonuclease n=1 Tax=Maricaulis sp. TaxID=1486257 RepID=UPI0025BD37E8|nr:YicC/YloC family endoribonuclease [Maricaulis sp.]